MKAWRKRARKLNEEHGCKHNGRVNKFVLVIPPTPNPLLKALLQRIS